MTHRTATIDAFGQLRLNGAATVRARIIQVTPIALVVFPEADPDGPFQVTLSEPARLRGRVMTATLADDGGTLEFQRAGCGCQTPSSLRGPASRFLARLQPAEA